MLQNEGKCLTAKTKVFFSFVAIAMRRKKAEVFDFQ